MLVMISLNVYKLRKLFTYSYSLENHCNAPADTEPQMTPMSSGRAFILSPDRLLSPESRVGARPRRPLRRLRSLGSCVITSGPSTHLPWDITAMTTV
jgi:hypothetical protein